MRDEACAAFFVSAVVELDLDRHRHFRTRAEIEAERDPWTAPAQWRITLEVCRSIRVNKSHSKIELLKAVRIVEPYLENGVHERERRNDPYVFKRSSGKRNDDELRGRVRVLALEMHKIFGSFRYGTIATVVKVALDLPERAINGKTVRNWCAGLTPANKRRQ